MTAALRRLWWRLTWRITTPCAQWPCKRCDKAGRTSWRSRERWHIDRRDRALGVAEKVIAIVALPLLAVLIVAVFA